MSSSPRFVSPTTFTRLALALGVTAASCAQPKVDAPVASTTAALTAAATGTSPGNLDVLFMIDNSSSMTVMQQKLATQIPGFVAALQNLPAGLPNIHIAVVSSDLGAPGDSTSSIECSKIGDDGQFQDRQRRVAARSISTLVSTAVRAGGAPGRGRRSGAPSASCCAGASLSGGATYISNVDGVANYTGDLSTLLSCMTALGDSGCGFEHQLASISRALGADGSPAPARTPASCAPTPSWPSSFSATRTTAPRRRTPTLYSLNGGQQNISNPLGPIANYRCNQFGHLCVDPAAVGVDLPHGAAAQPTGRRAGDPLAPTLDLADCESNDSHGMLTSVSSFVSGIRALKADPDNQIVVGAIVAPPTPYTVAWVPEAGGQNTGSGRALAADRALLRSGGRRRRQPGWPDDDGRKLRRSGGADRAVGAGVRRQRRHGLDLRRQLCERVQRHREQDRRSPAGRQRHASRARSMGRPARARFRSARTASPRSPVPAAAVATKGTAACRAVAATSPPRARLA